jgi:TonB family protein
MNAIAHLWQSTLCVAVAALVVQALRRAPARYRHAIWMLAAAKFLVPFSILVAAGASLSTWLAPSDLPLARWIDRSMPFLTLRVANAPQPSASPLADPIWIALPIVWMAGVSALAVWRVRQWRETAGLVQRSVPLQSGREADALARATRQSRCPRSIQLRVGDAGLEPGVIGVLTPVIVWPAGLSDRLTDEEMAAVLAHEVAHVTRHDNLFARVQMAVETLFWFYPLTWWLGTKIVNERERACDEEVVHMGTNTQSYAAGILKVCGFCLRAPAAFAAGVGGSNLAQRVERIVTASPYASRVRTAKLLGLSFALAMTVAPLTLGALGATSQEAQEPNVYTMKQAGVTAPRLVKETKPRYTADAMRAKIQGIVRLEAVVRPDGTITDIKVTQSLDKDLGLDNQAIEAMKKWEFKPGTKDGKPVAVRIEAEMSFRLK